MLKNDETANGRQGIAGKKKGQRASFQQLLIVHILFFITRYFSRGLCMWLVQYNTKVDVKVSCNLILVSARNRHVCGEHVSHKSKSKLRNIAQVTREQIGYLWKLIRNAELAVPPIVDWDCIMYLS